MHARGTRRLRVRCGAATGLALLAALASPARAAEEIPARQGIDHDIDAAYTGDLDGMLERRRIRVLVSVSKTFYFVDKGRQLGLSYDAGVAFESDLNRKLRETKGARHRPVEVVFVPVLRDDLLPALLEGRGDIAAANLTITPERQQWVDFTHPLWTGVDEIAVSGPGGPKLERVEDLAGREILVRLSSSYFQSLWHLNARFEAQGLPAVRVRPAPEQLEDEDLLEMVSAGLLPLAIVDDYKAEFWAQILPGLVLHPGAAVRSQGEVAWALRKQSPQLKAALDDFARRHGKGSLFGNTKFREYLKSTKHVRNATAEQEINRFLHTIHAFQKYADRYAFDWLLLAAQGYQESRLDQSVKSPVGAIGVMQVMPATGAEMRVGDLRQMDSNIHAGTKYLRTLIDTYFPDAQFDELNRCLFAFAAYNAGPNRIARLRKLAASRGLDPNVWFDHVETVVAEQVGQEPIRYVANIFKYYVAYQLVVEQQTARSRSFEALRPATGAEAAGGRPAAP